MPTLLLQILGAATLALCGKIFYDRHQQSLGRARLQEAFGELERTSMPLRLEFEPTDGKGVLHSVPGYLSVASEANGYAVVLTVNSGGSYSAVSDVVKVDAGKSERVTRHGKVESFDVMDEQARAQMFGGGGRFVGIMTPDAKTLHAIVDAGFYLSSEQLQRLKTAWYPAK